MPHGHDLQISGLDNGTMMAVVAVYHEGRERMKGMVRYGCDVNATGWVQLRQRIAGIYLQTSYLSQLCATISLCDRPGSTPWLRSTNLKLLCWGPIRGSPVTNRGTTVSV